MKKLSAILLGSVCALLSLSGCNAEDLTTPEEYLRNEYLVNWIKRYGLIDPNQDWTLAERVSANINVESFGPGHTLHIYTADPAKGGLKIAEVSTSGAYYMDVIEGSKQVFVRAYDESGERFIPATFTINKGQVDISASSRAGEADYIAETPESRALAETSETDYTWILACEDLGSTGDTDFNDIVLGVKYDTGTKRLSITALAAGGILGATVYYNSEEVFEIHGGFADKINLGPNDKGTYTMYNTDGWNGPGKTWYKDGVNDFTLSEGLGGISIVVEKSGEKTGTRISAPGKGGAPQIICVPATWQWPKETVDINLAYEKFGKWTASANTDWYTTPKAPFYVKRNIPTSDPEPTYSPTPGERTGDIGGRNYIIYVPDGVQKNAPVVFSLHGANGYYGNRIPFTKAIADKVKCIVVYPNGQSYYFGPFGQTSGWWADGTENHEISYFRALLNKVEDEGLSINRDRVYCCGFSNGGMMTYAAANAAPDMFAACAAISGFQVNEFHHSHYGDRPVPFLHIHGKNDRLVNYHYIGIIRDDMVARNGCNPNPTVTTGSVNGSYWDDGTKKTYTGTYKKSEYAAGDGRFPYILYEVENMGHYDYVDNIGGKSSDRIMWEFFSQFTRTSACDNTLKWRLNPNAFTSGNSISDHGWIDSTYGSAYIYGSTVAPDETSLPTSQWIYSPQSGVESKVYRSLQFKPGSYYLVLNTTGPRIAPISVVIERHGSNGTDRPLCRKTKSATGEVIMPFTISKFGDYKIIIPKSYESKDNGYNKLSKLEIHSGSVTDNGTSEVDNNFTTTIQAEYSLGTFEDIAQDRTVNFDKTNYTTETIDGKTVNVYTSTAHVQIAFKTEGIEVDGYDYVIIRFAEPIGPGWSAGFTNDQNTYVIAEGATEFKYNIPSGTTTLPNVTLIRMYTLGNTESTVAKVLNVQKHKKN